MADEIFKVAFGPWPERIGNRARVVTGPSDEYPWHGLGDNEVVVLIEDDPFFRADHRYRGWTCVLAKNDLVPLCRCGKLSVGDSRNWNPDCPEHGTESEWWQSPEQVAQRQKQNERLRSLQAQARDARRAARDQQERLF